MAPAPSSAPRKRYSPATIRQIRAELANGASLLATARKWGVSARYISRLKLAEVRQDARLAPSERGAP